MSVLCVLCLLIYEYTDTVTSSGYNLLSTIIYFSFLYTNNGKRVEGKLNTDTAPAQICFY